MMEIKTLTDLIAQLEVAPDMSRFDSNKSFRDNGFDSLDVMTVFLAVEENYGIKISEDESLRINSPAQLLSAINARG
jgi:acyl carrier protein